LEDSLQAHEREIESKLARSVREKGKREPKQKKSTPIIILSPEARSNEKIASVLHDMKKFRFAPGVARTLIGGPLEGLRIRQEQRKLMKKMAEGLNEEAQKDPELLKFIRSHPFILVSVKGEIKGFQTVGLKKPSSLGFSSKAILEFKPEK